MSHFADRPRAVSRPTEDSNPVLNLLRIAVAATAVVALLVGVVVESALVGWLTFAGLASPLVIAIFVVKGVRWEVERVAKIQDGGAS